MIPTLLGNLVGGGLFVATAYWYLYLTGEDNIQIEFNLGSQRTAMEVGGPMRREKRQDQGQSDDAIIGLDPDDLPHSSGHMMSALGHELSDGGPFTKSHAERSGKSDCSVTEKV